MSDLLDIIGDLRQLTGIAVEKLGDDFNPRIYDSVDKAIQALREKQEREAELKSNSNEKSCDNCKYSYDDKEKTQLCHNDYYNSSNYSQEDFEKDFGKGRCKFWEKLKEQSDV